MEVRSQKPEGKLAAGAKGRPLLAGNENKILVSRGITV